MSFDLLLRYAIIQVAISLACVWMQTFSEPWPLVHAFDLADTAQEQLFQSLGMRFDSSLVGDVIFAILSTTKPFLCVISSGVLSLPLVVLSGAKRSQKTLVPLPNPTDTPANPPCGNLTFGLVGRVFGLGND